MTNIDAWLRSGYTTQDLRNTANALREEMSGIVLEGENSFTPKDRVLMQAVEALAVAADRIDRLQQDVAPVITHTSTSLDANDLFLFGTDSTGQVWQYSFGGAVYSAGWMPLEKQAVLLEKEPENPPGSSDTH